MKKWVVLASSAAVFTACTPDIPYTAPPGGGTYVVAQFDPANSVVPTPTILVYDPVNRRLQVPLAPGASPAQQDFVAFLNSLDGYPEDTPGSVSFSGNLDPSSVSASSVLILDAASGTPIAGASAVLSAPNQLSIVPPVTGWPVGKLIAVAVIGGSNGVKGGGGAQVIGTPTWGLVSSTSPLVTNCDEPLLPDRTPNPQCLPAVSVIPSNEHDLGAQVEDRARSAAQLEAIRRLYAPLLDALQARNIPRASVATAWTFPVTSRPQVPFDPARSIVPFPNDILRTTVLPDGGRQVSLPVPDGGPQQLVDLYTGLNTLDGFSTTAPIVSVFNADNVAALNQGNIDAGSLVFGAGWGFSRLTGTPAHAPTDAGVTACLDCAVSYDGGVPKPAQRLQFVPNVPLDERTTYGLYMTTNITDTQGHKVIPSSAFVLLRSANPLYDGTKSTVDLITDDQARQLEPLRVALSPFIANVARLVQGRENVALAWVFTTQTEVTALAGLQALPSNPLLALPANPIFAVPTATGSHTYRGEILTPQVLNGPGGTLSPTNPTVKKVPISVQVPLTTGPTACPPGPYAVTIFGHGLTRSRADGLVVAPALTAFPHCQVVIATEAPWHGDRSFCAGSLPFLQTVLSRAASDDDACRDVALGRTMPGKCDENPASTTFGRCIAVNPATRAACDPRPGAGGDQYCSDPSRRQGLCLPDASSPSGGKCEGGDFRRGTDELAFDTTPLISGWNILNLTNLFTTRDNFRQQVVDLAQLSRVITATGPGSLDALLGGGVLEPSNINYAGQSLGGILGTLYTSVAPDVNNVVLNVAGADPGNILLLSPSFTPQRTAFLATLAGLGIVPGTIAFDTFVATAKWILDPADPQNMIYSVRNGGNIPASTLRHALIQYITHDEVVPNPTTEELINAANNRSGTFNEVDTDLFDPSTTTFPGCPTGVCPPGQPTRHGFLLQSDPRDTDQTTRTAQCHVANYLANGSLPTTCP